MANPRSPVGTVFSTETKSWQSMEPLKMSTPSEREMKKMEQREEKGCDTDCIGEFNCPRRQD